MITFDKALKLVLENVGRLLPERVEVIDSADMILDEDVYSRIQMPPFNKSAMDGYAMIADDTVEVPVELKCIGEVQAGGIFRKKVRQGECVKIMTGAPLAYSTDSVVMVENTQQIGQYVRVMKCVKKGENVCMCGEDLKVGQKVLKKGTRIYPEHISLLGSIGRRFIKVIRRPRVAIINTGNEIVPIGEKLRKYKIYNSNGPQLSALLKSDNIKSFPLGIAEDNSLKLKAMIKKGLDFDVLLISGGVSMGDYDLVPDVLKEVGVEEIFHKVRIKPGKPLFFGARMKTVIFGIPGNPVANFVVYQLFIRPALRKIMGYQMCRPHFEKGIVKRSFHKRTDRKHFVPVKVLREKGMYYLAPLSSHGSADIFALSRADGFMVVEADVLSVKENSIQSFFTWKRIA